MIPYQTIIGENIKLRQTVLLDRSSNEISQTQPDLLFLFRITVPQLGPKCGLEQRTHQNDVTKFIPHKHRCISGDTRRSQNLNQ